MPLEMRPATPADGPALVAVYLSAFSDNPVARTCFPSTSAVCREFLTKVFTEGVDDPRARILVVTEAAAADDDGDKQDPDAVIAWAKWIRPAEEGEVNVAAPPAPEVWPTEGHPAFASEFFGAIGRQHAAIVGDVRHWYLELVVCRKDHQGRGAATPLLRWGCEQADAQGTVAFLESMPGAKAVYEKYGFATVAYMEFETPDGLRVPQDFMVRRGRAAEGDHERVLENVRRLKRR